MVSALARRSPPAARHERRSAPHLSTSTAPPWTSSFRSRGHRRPATASSTSVMHLSKAPHARASGEHLRVPTLTATSRPLNKRRRCMHRTSKPLEPEKTKLCGSRHRNGRKRDCCAHLRPIECYNADATCASGKAADVPQPATDFSATRRTRRPYAFLSVWYRCAASGFAGLAQFGSVSKDRIAIRMEQTE